MIKCIGGNFDGLEIEKIADRVAIHHMTKDVLPMGDQTLPPSLAQIYCVYKFDGEFYQHEDEH